MRSEWRDPTDMMPSATRTARTVRGWRSYDPLRKCRQRHGDRSSFTERHVVAADILRGLADGACIGFSTERDLSIPVTAIIYRPSLGPSKYAERQARCWRRFVRTMAIFTRQQRELLTLVVLMNVSVQRIARARDGHANKLLGQMVAILDLLGEHFHSEVDEALARGMAA